MFCNFPSVVSGRRVRNLDTNGIPTTIEEFNNGMWNFAVILCDWLGISPNLRLSLVLFTPELWAHSKLGGTWSVDYLQLGSATAYTGKHGDTATQLVQATLLPTVCTYGRCTHSSIDSSASVKHSSFKFYFQVLSTIFR
jgi:hypothetical protein